jgi:WD40 repeat protein
MDLFSPDSKSILFYEDGKLNFRDVLSHQINYSIDLVVYQFYAEMFNYRFSPDGKHMLILCYDKSPLIIELSTGKEIQSIQIDDLEWAIWGEFAADGKSVFVGGPYDWVYRWDLDNQEVIQKYFHKQWGFLHFAVTNDAKYLVGGGGWCEAGVWNVETGAKLHTIPSKNVPPQLGTVLVLPGQNYALLCEGTGGLIVEIASGKIIRELAETEEAYFGIFDAAVSHKTRLC